MNLGKPFTNVDKVCNADATAGNLQMEHDMAICGGDGGILDYFIEELLGVNDSSWEFDFKQIEEFLGGKLDIGGDDTHRGEKFPSIGSKSSMDRNEAQRLAGTSVELECNQGEFIPQKQGILAADHVHKHGGIDNSTKKNETLTILGVQWQLDAEVRKLTERLHDNFSVEKSDDFLRCFTGLLEKWLVVIREGVDAQLAGQLSLRGPKILPKEGQINAAKALKQKKARDKYNCGVCRKKLKRTGGNNDCDCVYVYDVGMQTMSDAEIPKFGKKKFVKFRSVHQT